MLTRIRHNFRAVSLVMALTVLVAAVAPASVWRCLDGTPCPMGGVMPHASEANRAPAKHSCCHPVAAVTPDGESVSSAMRCVLTHSDSPAASLVRSEAMVFAADYGIVLSRPAPRVIQPLQPAEWVIHSSDLPPPDFPSARSGRSPPASAS
jgi:hypothetical protein